MQEIYDLIDKVSIGLQGLEIISTFNNLARLSNALGDLADIKKKLDEIQERYEETHGGDQECTKTKN